MEGLRDTLRPEDALSSQELLDVDVSFNSKINLEDAPDKSLNGDDKTHSERTTKSIAPNQRPDGAE